MTEGIPFIAKPFKSEDIEMNMSTTAAPVLDGKQNLIKLHFNGLFQNAAHESEHEVEENKVFPPRYESSHSN